jgi:hypothetical protein
MVPVGSASVSVSRDYTERISCGVHVQFDHPDIWPALRRCAAWAGLSGRNFSVQQFMRAGRSTPVGASKYYTEDDICEICDGPVVVYLTQDCTAEGIWLTPVVQQVRCLHGCAGRNVLFGICEEFGQSRSA